MPVTHAGGMKLPYKFQGSSAITTRSIIRENLNEGTARKMHRQILGLNNDPRKNEEEEEKTPAHNSVQHPCIYLSAACICLARGRRVPVVTPLRHGGHTEAVSCVPARLVCTGRVPERVVDRARAR